MQKYRLQFFFKGTVILESSKILTIHWATDLPNYVPGDFYVRAIKEETDVEKFNEENFQNQRYSEPMTIEEARKFIAGDIEAVGDLVNDCMGLTLEDDNDKKVLFKEPIPIIPIRR